MAPAGYDALRGGHVRVELPLMTYFVLTGTDHREWLQGQATNDIDLLESRPWLDFCLTKPTGQMLAVCRAWGTQSTVTIATQQPDVLLARAEETVILEDVTIMSVQEKFACIQGPGADETKRALASDRTGSGGYELPAVEAFSGEPLSKEAYELATLEAGIPLAGVDWSEKTLPPELGPNFTNQHVSYSKGCYVGQEVLMRIKARGHTNKTWVGLRSTEPINPGATVVFEGKQVGVVHRSAQSPAFGHIASATVRNEATQEGTVIHAGNVECSVFEMPFIR